MKYKSNLEEQYKSNGIYDSYYNPEGLSGRPGGSTAQPSQPSLEDIVIELRNDLNIIKAENEELKVKLRNIEERL